MAGSGTGRLCTGSHQGPVDKVHFRSVFVGQEESRDGSVCFCNDPDAITLSSPIGAMKSIARFKRLIIESPVVGANFAPVMMDMAEEELDR